jgi:hypothetical protein
MPEHDSSYQHLNDPKMQIEQLDAAERSLPNP